MALGALAIRPLLAMCCPYADRASVVDRWKVCPVRETVDERREEFFSHVWDHTQDQFQQSFDLVPPLEDNHRAALVALVSVIRHGADDDELSSGLRATIKTDPTFVYKLIQLLGLTRSKLGTDMKPLGYNVPKAIERSVLRDDLWDAVGAYLVVRTRSILTNLVSSEGEGLYGPLEALNQSTWPGYIRQERAKRSGGYAEQRLAILLKSLGIPFAPEKKAENGLTADATVAGESFDLVVPNAEAPALCIVSMAHSANVGQYGESKADDARRAKEALAALTRAPLLGVLADGVGFESNSGGLTSVLTNADEFFQFETLWKAAVVAASVSGLSVTVVLPDADKHSAFLKRYARAVEAAPSLDTEPGWVDAGEASIRPGLA